MTSQHADSATASAEQRHAPHADHAPVVADTTQANESLTSTAPATLLSSPAAAGRGNGTVRAAALQRMQQTYGNRAVQRFLAVQRASADPAGLGAEAADAELAVQRAGGGPCKDSEEVVVQTFPASGAIPAVQRNGDGTTTGTTTTPADTATPMTTPTGPVWDPTKRVTPTFPVDRPPAKRSNTDPSTTKEKAVTFTGGVAVDTKANVWRYQLSAVDSPGTIQLVYYTDDHYPAPTPTDDSGSLSNVTQANWKTIVKDLKDNRSGVPNFWSAYKRESLHEDYHWNTEWQGKVKPEVVNAENDIAKLQVDFATAPTAAAAEATLKPQATTIFNAAMKKAKDEYYKLGDSSGDPPYVAQAPALDALRDRVEKYAAANKW